MSDGAEGSVTDEDTTATSTFDPDTGNADRGLTGDANPSSEPEARMKSPPGGNTYEDDEPAAEDPEGAPDAYGLLWHIIGAAAVVIVLLAVAAVVDSTIVLVIALVSILPGLAVVVRAIFRMMSTDEVH